METTRKDYDFINTGLSMCFPTEGRKCKHLKAHCSIRCFDTRKSKEASSFIIQMGLPLQPAPPALLTGFPVSTLEGLRPKRLHCKKFFCFSAFWKPYCTVPAFGVRIIIKAMCEDLCFKHVVLQYVLSYSL